MKKIDERDASKDAKRADIVDGRTTVNVMANLILICSETWQKRKHSLKESSANSDLLFHTPFK